MVALGNWVIAASHPSHVAASVRRHAKPPLQRVAHAPSRTWPRRLHTLHTILQCHYRYVAVLAVAVGTAGYGCGGERVDCTYILRWQCGIHPQPFHKPDVAMFCDA